MDNLLVQKFREVNLNDPFFDSLKEGYSEFSDWFKRKSNDNALVLYNDNDQIEGFLYCKFESGPGNDTYPLLPDTNHMKVGTFKFNPMGTRRGDRYLKKIFDYAFKKDVEDIYVTVFGQQHEYLVELFSKYGFEHYANKTTTNGVEHVLLRSLNTIQGDVNKDYPLINTNNNRKFLLGILPFYHTNLFPDSILNTESTNIVKDVSHSNSIHKIYICNMKQVMEFRRGDNIVIYRMKDSNGPAEYTAVATSLCVVESVHTIDKYKNEQEFIRECSKFSVFDEAELSKIYRERKYTFIINFTYNVALPKRLIRQKLADEVGLSRDERWGCIEISSEQFNNILKISEVNPKFIKH
ncbi:N-acetyltransferase [Photobacterium phosphoreum]|uniref:N-acetyltransferase n=1 Tax=Photobacterium phosphoreum TaxID=659 RepID=UPI001E3AF122|nr:N-acetyltransferase [Photobacterium phosphoreum]MCD9506561.1 N-acetyltransferase [Photobacterium phosphoreum]